jgi:U3 small nucleolar RNA-associated protein 21
MGLLNGNSEASKHHVKLEDLKAPAITCMACSLNRDGGMGAMPGVAGIWNNSSKVKGQDKKAIEVNMTGWESIVTGHAGDKTARTWFWGRKRAGRWAFDTGDGTEVKSVAISSCGTFAVIGSAGGSIDMYNLQSGQFRRRFPARLTPVEAKQHKLRQLQAEEALEFADDAPRKFAKGEGKHKGAITGLAVDALNRTLLSCSDDGKVKVSQTSVFLIHQRLTHIVVLGFCYGHPTSRD